MSKETQTGYIELPIENTKNKNKLRLTQRGRLVRSIALLAVGGTFVVGGGAKAAESFIQNIPGSIAEANAAAAERAAFKPIDSVETKIGTGQGLDAIMDTGVAALEKKNPNFDAASINTEEASRSFSLEYKKAFPGKPIAEGIGVTTILEQNDNGDYAVEQHLDSNE